MGKRGRCTSPDDYDYSKGKLSIDYLKVVNDGQFDRIVQAAGVDG